MSYDRYLTPAMADVLAKELPETLPKGKPGWVGRIVQPEPVWLADGTVWFILRVSERKPIRYLTTSVRRFERRKYYTTRYATARQIYQVMLWRPYENLPVIHKTHDTLESARRQLAFLRRVHLAVKPNFRR